MTADGTVDVLMITYRRPEAVRRSLPRLLQTCDERTRVWLWHNGEHEETLDVVRGFADDPRVARFHHSRENVRLREPTQWLWENSRADYLSKVDDDCLETPGWVQTLRAAHEECAQLGVVAAWRHYEDEFLPAVAGPKIRSLGRHRVMQNHWVQGSGYLVRRTDVERFGPLGQDGSFTAWCIRLAKAGRINGYYFPFLHEDHMDDPRSPNTLLHTDEDLLRAMPLSAQRNDVRSLAEWEERNRRAARTLQEAPLDLRQYGGWRVHRARVTRRLRDVARGRRTAW